MVKRRDFLLGISACIIPICLKYNRSKFYKNKRFIMAGFNIQGAKIFSPDGTEFIVKGANLLGMIFEKAKVYSAAEVDIIKNAWKFNTVRMPFRINKNGTPYDGYKEFDANVKVFTDAGIVIMFEAHDTAGVEKNIAYYTNNSDPSLGSLSKKYKELALRYKNNPYVWFDLVNEPDWGKSDKTNWLGMHQTLIKAIRDEASADNVIVVEGWWYGQDTGSHGGNALVGENQSAILSLGNQIKSFNNKTYKNIAFSFHVYDQWISNSEARLADYLNKAIAKGHAVFVGEYGLQNANQNTFPATKGVFAAAPPRNVGRMVWSYDASARNICKDGTGAKINSKTSKPTNLTELGSIIWDDNRRTEKLAKLNVSPTTPPIVPTTPVIPASNGVNLIVESVKIKPESVQKGAKVVFQANIKNTGNKAIPSGWIGVLFYVNGTYVNWGGLEVSIPAGGSVSISSSEWVATSSAFELKALVDDHNVVNETSETDNSATLKVG